MTSFTDDENKYYEEQKECYICQKELCYNKNQKKKFKLHKKKLEIIVIFQENLEGLLIAFVI